MFALIPDTTASTPLIIKKENNLNPGSSRSVRIPITQSHPDKKDTPGTIYGSGDMAIIFSNMDTNSQKEWFPVINGVNSDKIMVLTYDYLGYEDDQSQILLDAISFVHDLGAKKIILVGASRGGVASIKVAFQALDSDNIIGVAALSAPIEYDGCTFYSTDQLRCIKIPTLVINSENDDGAADTVKMHDLFTGPKNLFICPGDAHGTEMFQTNGDAVIKQLQNFINTTFGLTGQPSFDTTDLMPVSVCRHAAVDNGH